MDDSDGVGLDALATYLSTRGWHPTDRADERRVIWADNRGRRIFVPAQAGPDTSELVAYAIAKLAAYEDRSESAVAADLAWPSYDRLAVRRETPMRASVAFDDGLVFHQASYDLIVAAALASREPQSTYAGGRRSTYVNRYLESVRMVPSIAGSFVVRALLPLKVQELQTQDEELPIAGLEPVLTGRPASMMILEATRVAVHTAAQLSIGDAELVAWEETVTHGVSSNLCDALVALTGQNGGGDVGLRIDWSPTAPPNYGESQVLVPQHLRPYLSAGSEFLKTETDVETIEMRGLVTNLHRETSFGPGEVTMKGAVEGDRVRSIRFELDGQSYSEAVSAHDEGGTMHLRAVVRREGRRLVVTEIKQLVRQS